MNNISISDVDNDLVKFAHRPINSSAIKKKTKTKQDSSSQSLSQRMNKLKEGLTKTLLIDLDEIQDWFLRKDVPSEVMYQMLKISKCY